MSARESAREPDLLTVAVEAATRAPSPHNTQPWWFRCGPDWVEVHLDRSRILEIADPDAREARLSCGAAVFNLRAAVRGVGRDSTLEWLPDRGNMDVLARVHWGDRVLPTPGERALAEAIAERRTHRRPFSNRPLLGDDRRVLVEAATAEGAELILLDDPADLDAVAVLIRRADHRQRTDAAFEAELRYWTHDAPGRVDGIPALADRTNDEESMLALRTVTEAGHRRPTAGYERRPHVAVLRSYTDTPLAQLRCGQALQRVLLTAAVHGVSASFLCQPVEIPDTRAALRHALGDRGYPQAILRLGYGSVAPGTPRRAPAVLDVERDRP